MKECHKVVPFAGLIKNCIFNEKLRNVNHYRRKDKNKNKIDCQVSTYYVYYINVHTPCLLKLLQGM